MPRKTVSVSILAVMIVALTLVSPLQAAAFVNPIYRSEWYCGLSRCVQLRGQITLAAGESVGEVRIFTNSANGAPLSQAGGTFNTTNNSYSASIGDYQLASYYLTIKIKKNGRVVSTLRTPTCYWGVP